MKTKRRLLKKMVLGTFLLMGVSTFAGAQGGNGCHRGDFGSNVPAEEKAQKQTEHMSLMLDLTAEQKEKVEALNLKFAQESEASRKKMQEEREARRATKHAEMKTILTAEQFAKFEAMGPDRQNGNRGHGRK